MLHDTEASIMLWTVVVCMAIMSGFCSYFLYVEAKPQHCPDRPFSYPEGIAQKQEVINM